MGAELGKRKFESEKEKDITKIFWSVKEGSHVQYSRCSVGCSWERGALEL